MVEEEGEGEGEDEGKGSLPLVQCLYELYRRSPPDEAFDSPGQGLRNGVQL